MFEIGSEAKHVGLGLQRLHGEFVGGSLLRLDRPATQLLHRLGKEIGMCLVLTLELYREIEHRFLEEPAVGADLIGGYRRDSEPSMVLRMLASLAAAPPVAWASWPARRATPSPQHGPTRPHQERAPRSEQAKRRMQK